MAVGWHPVIGASGKSDNRRVIPACFAPTALAHVAWTAALERELHPGRPALSRWHYADDFEVYTRVGTASWRLPKQPVVVLANITVFEHARGRGLLGSVLRALDEAGNSLRARHIVMEKVGNERLAARLRSEGWTEFALVPGDTPSFHRPRGAGVEFPD